MVSGEKVEVHQTVVGRFRELASTVGRSGCVVPTMPSSRWPGFCLHALPGHTVQNLDHAERELVRSQELHVE